MKQSDAWIYALIGGLILWWLFGRQVNATVTVPQAEVTARWKGPLETAAHESPAGGGRPLEAPDTVTMQSWLEDW